MGERTPTAGNNGGETDTPRRGTNPPGITLAGYTGPFWSAEHTATQMRADPAQPPHQQGNILALRTSDSHTVYPAWQFHRTSPAAPATVLPPVIEMLRTLSEHDGWVIATLLKTPAPELGGISPLEWILQDRDGETLTRFTRNIRREWSR